MLNLITNFAEAVPTVALSADWYTGITSVISANAPALLAGGVAIVGISAGMFWVVKSVKKIAK